MNAALAGDRFRKLGREDQLLVFLLLSKVKTYSLNFFLHSWPFWSIYEVQRPFQVADCEIGEHGQLYLLENVRHGVLHVQREAQWHGWLGT